MSNPPTRPPGRKHIMTFRLSQAEYQALAEAARLEKRKMSDLVYLIVTDALERYTKRLATAANEPSRES